MAKNNSINSNATNNSDGFDLSGGVVARKITVSAGDVSFIGGGSAVVTFPTSTSTLATLALVETLTNKRISTTISDTQNAVPITLVQNDTTNNPNVLVISNTGTGKSILVNNASGLEHFTITGAAGVVINEAGTATTDFRVEGDTMANLLFVDASADAVSIQGTLTVTGVLTITAAFLPTTSDGGALGSATKMWSDLFLASGAVINFNNGDVTLTHTADLLTIAGGNLTVPLMSLGKAVATNTLVSLKNLNATTIRGVVVEGDNVANIALASYVTSDAQLRFTITNGGVMEWGDGTNAVDVNLFRASANVLETDDSLTVSQGLVVNEDGLSTGDTRIEGDSMANLFFVDASVDFIGVNQATPHSRLHVTGSMAHTYTAFASGPQTLDATHYMVDCTTGTFTVNLPTAVGIAGRVYVVKNSGAGTITIDGSGAETIDGSATKSMAVQYGVCGLMSDGTNWKVISN